MSDVSSSSRLVKSAKVILAVIGLYFAGQFGAAVVYALLVNSPEDSLTAFETLLVSGTLFGVIAVGLYLILDQHHRTWRKKAEVLHVRKPKWATLGYSLLGFGTYFVIMLFVYAILSSISLIDLDQTQDIGFSRDSTGIDAVVAFIGLVIFASVVEELLFRGYLHQKLKVLTNLHFSAIVTSFLFGLAHRQLNVAIDTFVLSMVIIYVLEEHDNVLAAITIHALKNGYAFLFIFVL